MTPRRRRLVFVLLGLSGVAAAAALALSAFRDNVLYFYSPTQIAAGQAPTSKAFRVAVSYSGVLPDLFREGQGVIARGHLSAPGVFTADEVLAKHDEKYMPPEVSQSLRKAYNDRHSAQTASAGN